jgi:nicotinamidase-related amidase
MISPDDAVLVVIDMQEKLVPAMNEMHNLIRYTETLVRGCALLSIPIIFTQQYTKGLGETIKPIADAYTETASGANKNVKRAVDDQLMPYDQVSFSYVEKTSFGAMGEPAFAEALEREGRRDIILCGIETHVCVMQSAEGFLRHGYTVRVAADATASRRSLDSHFALARMAQNGTVVTTSEALLFELMKDSKHPMFRQLSSLIK